ncbi:hypothetical protein SEA_SHAKENBAKE_10 [Streptomyces phage ShakeNBake]|jgi:hypothetical protein|nr:hypothetical protein SEA_SHAKENBAKE_10 [Streptomyces phage ShakeNBake]
MSAIDIFLAKGKKGLILEKDWLTREEKEEVRARFGPEGSAGVWFLEVPDEPEPVGDFDEEQEIDEDPTTNPVEPKGDEPTLSDLEGLTVAQLRDLAAKEELDVSDLKLKADLVGRLAAHFGVQI